MKSHRFDDTITRAGFALLFAALAAGAAAQDAATPGDPQNALATFSTVLQRAAGLTSPIGLAHAGDNSNRLFVIEQAGCIRFYLNGAIVGAPCGQAGTRFLDIRTKIASGGERGLLGLAFHPQYASNGFFYVYYTSVASAGPPARNTGDIVIARYTVSADPNVANPASEQILLVIPHSINSNHNGGQLNFGPDGFLYAAVGDGGAGDDPFEAGQDVNQLLGKLLRIDVNVATAPFYRIPPTNPIQTGGPGTCTNGCDEIWAYGLRNPWRFSFDRGTGDLYIGDVGQNAWEEVDFQPAGAAGGRNYGWDVLEGGLHGGAQVPAGNCHENVPAGSCTALLNGGSTLPILEYGRTVGSTVIGGNVYRGRPASAVWTGAYAFADFGSGRVWRAFRDGTGAWQMPEMFTGITSITSFGEDDLGNLHFTRITGTLHQIVPYTFADVPPTSVFWNLIERIYEAGVTGGCGGDNYCPATPTTREQMAVFVLKALDRTLNPPACGTPRFSDVPASSPFCRWIEELARRQVVSGCGGNAYCPASSVTRAQMAVFALATLEGPTFSPPACTTPMFNDVPASSPFCRWIEELARRGIVAGCGNGNYCPDAAATRGEMAAFLVGTFSLP
jgi:glucose/arabinose dehydrogenase